MPRTTSRKYSISIYFDKPIPTITEAEHNNINITASFKSIRSAFKHAMKIAEIYDGLAKPDKITITYNTTSGIKMQTWFIAPEKE